VWLVDGRRINIELKEVLSIALIGIEFATIVILEGDVLLSNFL
jgi:hypothetical protein